MRYVLVGTGHISNTYTDALEALSQSGLVGCVSRTGRRLSAAPNLPSWPSLKSVDADFDAVILATPNGLHHKGAIEAASLGKHVLTEKPLDITESAMDRMMEACERAGVTLGVCYQRRTKPDNRALAALLRRGALGRVFAADLTAKFYRPQAYYDSRHYRGGWSLDGGGPLMQQACHSLDLYCWFFGKPTQAVSMLGRFTHRIEAEDHGAALMRHPDGMIGTMVASTATYPGFACRLDLHTERGSVTLVDDRITDWSVEGVECPEQGGQAPRSVGRVSRKDTSAHQAVITDFEAAIREQRPPLADAASARQTTELVRQIYRSALRPLEPQAFHVNAPR